MKLHKVFEYGFIEGLNRSTLQTYLTDVWKERFREQDSEDDINFRQGVLQFDGNDAIAKNYIGFIQTEADQIEIYPKVFRKYELNSPNEELFQKHIFFWFSYCRKWKFPFTNVNLDSFRQVDLPELIIKLIADRFYEVINEYPISLYEEVEESLTMPRGRINFNRYVSNRLVNGNNHIIECDTEPFQYNNRLNRAIKYVTRLLMQKAKFIETRHRLDDILFLLDEVNDVPCTSSQLDSIRINSFYSEYQELINICKLILDQQIYNNQFYEQSQWCLLFPMEYVFEDFVAGFLERHFNKEWEVEYQKSDKYLTDQKVFQMRHDILLTSKKNKNLKIIVDTKYKLRSPKVREDGKRGIAQSDLYQMTSYAFRRGCNSVLLLYPNYSEKLQEVDRFTISSGYADVNTIDVIAAEIPFWSMQYMKGIEGKLTDELQRLFLLQVKNFKEQLSDEVKVH